MYSTSQAHPGETAVVMLTAKSDKDAMRISRSFKVAENKETITPTVGSKFTQGSSSTITDNSKLIPKRVIGYHYQ